MSSLKEIRWGPVPIHERQDGRRALAVALHAASAALVRLAASLVRDEPVRAEPRFEYHAEAGAPEGALYVDGRLVGWLRGVQRL